MVRLPSSDHVGLCTYIFSIGLSLIDFFENVIWGGFTEGVYVFVLHRAPQAVRHLPQKKCPTWSSTSSQWSSTALRLLKVCEINNLGRVKNSGSLIKKKDVFLHNDIPHGCFRTKMHWEEHFPSCCVYTFLLIKCWSVFWQLHTRGTTHL